MYDSHLEAQLQLWRQKAADGTITEEDYVVALTHLRAGRLVAAQLKPPKAVKPPKEPKPPKIPKPKKLTKKQLAEIAAQQLAGGTQHDTNHTLPLSTDS